MLKLELQFIKDTSGKQMVILSKKEYDAMIEELEDVEDVRLYDDAKKSKEAFIPVDKAFKLLETKRKKRIAHEV